MKENTNLILLTDRQLEILYLWSVQPKIKNIGEILGIAESTVQTQLKRMRNKLEVSRTFDVYIYARENDLFEDIKINDKD